MNRKRRNDPEGFKGKRGVRCPYCGSAVVLRSAEGIYHDNAKGIKLYVCTKYPACDAYVRVLEGTNTPAGSLANGDLRALRIEAHRCFDQIHRLGLMSRRDAYTWLAGVVAAPMAHAHIGQLGEYGCMQVIEESRKFIENNRARIRINSDYGAPKQRIPGGGRYAAEHRAAAAGGG